MSIQTAAALLARAREDAATVRAAQRVPEITDAIVGFHAQQAVEKSIKSVLAVRGEPFPFTHDLEGLLERCEAAGIDVPADVAEHAGLLTPYAVRHRYGADPPALVSRATAERVATAAVEWAGSELAAGPP